MIYFMFIVCLLHSFCFANSFFHQKTFLVGSFINEITKNENKDLFDKFEKYSLKITLKRKMKYCLIYEIFEI